jgi:hypothetical protein
MTDMSGGVVPDNRPGDRRIVQSLRRITIEIVIGFVGVYAAFALSAYKERVDALERRHQLKRALIREIIPLVEVSKRNAGVYRLLLTRLDSAVAAGGKPTPRPFVEPLAISMDVWEGAKQAGGLNLIDVPTFVRLSEFYNSWYRMAAYYAQLRDLSVNVILPNTGRNIDAFYDPQTGALRPAFDLMYRTDLRVLDNISLDAVRSGAEVIAILARDTT